MRVSRPTFPIARILLQEYSEDSAYQPSNKFGILRFFDILREYRQPQASTIACLHRLSVRVENNCRKIWHSPFFVLHLHEQKNNKGNENLQSQ